MLTYAKKDWTTSRLSCARWRSFDWLLGFEVLCVSVCTFVPVKQVILKNPLPLHLRRRNARCSSAAYVSIRSSAAYVSIRQHAPRQHTSAYAPRQHTSTYVSIRQHAPRQHTSAYVSTCGGGMHAAPRPAREAPPSHSWTERASRVIRGRSRELATCPKSHAPSRLRCPDTACAHLLSVFVLLY